MPSNPGHKLLQCDPEVLAMQYALTVNLAGENLFQSRVGQLGVSDECFAHTFTGVGSHHRRGHKKTEARCEYEEHEKYQRQ